jgi:UDP-N-acetylmuramyl pentapeptide synthase
MDFLLSIVKPHIGIYTKSDAVHSEQFGNPQAIAVDDMKMIRATKHLAFLNVDDIYARQVIDQLSIDILTYMTT